jgi:hypothetical protein
MRADNLLNTQQRALTRAEPCTWQAQIIRFRLSAGGYPDGSPTAPTAVHVQAAAAERSSWRLFILGVFSWMLGDAGRSVTAAVAENSYEAGY